MQIKIKKRRLSFLLAAMLLVSLIPAAAAAGDFEDVAEDDWFADAVRYVTENGLMNGVTDTQFMPYKGVTRAMLVTTLNRQAGSPEVTAENPFADVGAGEWYADAVCWAADSDIVKGYSETSFGPGDFVTREQLAVILYRYAEKQGADVSARGELDGFDDADKISDWAADALSWAVGVGLLNGVTDKMLVPSGNADRLQLAVILMRMFDKSSVAEDPALISAVDIYNIDYETQEWTLAQRLTYRYDENGYPVQLDKYDANTDEHSITDFEYEYEDGQPVSRTEFGNSGTVKITTEYENGKINDIYSETLDGSVVCRTMYQYANGDEYFTLQLFSRVCRESAEGEVSFTMEEADSVQVTTRNGLLEKTVNTGLYANWNADEEKEWMRFNGTYTACYDENGILSDTSSVFRAGPPGGKDVYDVTWENGRVTEVIKSIQYEGQEQELNQRFVFEYTDIGTDPGRYATMINDHITDSDNNYYRYYWY
ncbi:MAG: S-layer homology domain-containing protein [Oscillospiraceae bacterium]|nr:S-layer homology domain-containing protein [Oscillospiraceae bacterium]